jgi:hydrogenase maturation factor HypE|tara:strand:- start:3975 stop:4247 length:273 start_codon:yes stop_codon:yes gene_type:complete
MAGSDVKSKRLTGAGSASVGVARIRQLQVKTTTGSPRLTLTDGNGGGTILDMDLDASDTHSVNIPDDGIRVSDIYISTFTACTSVTVFYS